MPAYGLPYVSPLEADVKILVSGASGLIGSHLVPVLRSQGHQVFNLVRRPVKNNEEIQWTPDFQLNAGDFEAVIHLAGETIMGRWTDKKKAAILESRTVGTRNVAASVAAMHAKVFVTASAVGYYGPHGDEILTENSPSGDDFLAQVAREWETATESARQAGVRVVNLRIGVVLTPSGGALKQMLTPFRMGVGGRVGSGKQWMSWVALDDVIGAVLFALGTDSLSGPLNLVAPSPVTNAEFTKTLGHVLHRPTIFSVPATAIKIAFGEMGETLLLSGQRVVPKKLQESGYKFLHPEIGEALLSMLR
jgi:uncharacterized protein